MVPQAPEHNRGVWAKSVEMATRSYAKRAAGDVYVITGPVYVPSIAKSAGIGPGQVRVPKYLFKLVYDQSRNRAWAYWHENNDATRASRPISYGELVTRTGVEFLPGLRPGD
jgi:endonuclease G